MKFIAAACGAEIIGNAADVEVKAVSTDSRAAKAGDLFFAIKGDKYDGHDFIAEVAVKGVAAIVGEKNKVPAFVLNCPVLAVKDVRVALG